MLLKYMFQILFLAGSRKDEMDSYSDLIEF